MKSLMLFLVLSLSAFAGEIHRECTKFDSKVISFNEDFFAQDDVKIKAIYREFDYVQTGWGPQKRYRDLVVQIKVKDSHYDKGFDIDYISRPEARYLYDEGEFDIWELRLGNFWGSFVLDSFMPASWLKTPTYGTRSNPGFMGPSFRMRVDLK